MRKPSLAMTCAAGLVLHALILQTLAAQAPERVGRWVNLDAMDIAFLVLDVEPNGTLHRLIPAPQFSAIYRLDGERVEIRMSDGSTDQLVLRGDQLLRNNQPALARMTPPSHEQVDVRGTWRLLTVGSMEQFWTFRSDTQLILEVGFPGAGVLAGDTLRLANGDTFSVRQRGNTLFLQNSDRQRRFVRRPWGCFGTTFDATAAECQ